MKYIFYLLILLTLNFSKTNAVESYVVAKVNNRIVTNLDINLEYRYLTALNKDLKNVEKKRVMMLAKESIIREKIKETELLKYFNLEIENKYMQRILKNFYSKLGIKNEKEFKNYLSDNDLLFEDVYKKIKIEAAWNDLIFNRFSKKIVIDEEKIKQKVKKQISNKKKQNVYLLSEIMFVAKNSEEIKNVYKKIMTSINEIGFKNTANLYSLSDSAKLGGQVGWIEENQLTNIIKDEVKNLKIGDYTKPITIPGGLLILNLDNKKTKKEKVNFEKELNKQINYEKNLQLDQFSKIYYKKITKNSTISEN